MKKTTDLEKPNDVFDHTDAFYNQIDMLDAYIDELKLSPTEKEQLLLHIINSTDRAIEDAFLDGIRYTIKIAKKLCPPKEVMTA